MAQPTNGLSITLSPHRRPAPDSAPLEAKAGCLYPNNALALVEAHKRGFDNCVMLDQQGFVAELAIANLFMAKDGVVLTPVPNGTFLDGTRRQRVIRDILLEHMRLDVLKSGGSTALGGDAQSLKTTAQL